jgi:hypothetical protein
MFVIFNNISCTIYCNHRIAVTVYAVRNCVSRYVNLKTLINVFNNNNNDNNNITSEYYRKSELKSY